MKRRAPSPSLSRTLLTKTRESTSHRVRKIFFFYLKEILAPVQSFTSFECYNLSDSQIVDSSFSPVHAPKYKYR